MVDDDKMNSHSVGHIELPLYYCNLQYSVINIGVVVLYISRHSKNERGDENAFPYKIASVKLLLMRIFWS